MSIARDHALFRLDQTPLPHWPKPMLRRRVSAPQDPRDLGLSDQLTIGVIKNHLHLLWLQSHYAGRPLKAIAPAVQKILSVALYQLRFLTRIPPSAAVDEAVKQARRFGQSHASGFVNAILRKATREPNPPLPARTDARAYAEHVLSHPGDLFEELRRLVGDDDALRICEHDNAEPPTILRLDGPATVAELGLPAEIIITPHEQEGMAVIEPARPGILADLAERGWAQVQDPTAALVVPQLQALAGETALDRCCGLGTKTLQLRRAVGDSGRVVATDPSQERCRVLAGLLERRHISNVIVRSVGMVADLPPSDPRAFDRILIDAPCSNSGVMARRPEARYHQSAAALASLARLQDRILDDTAEHLKSGGRLVYSTCSIWPEENRVRVERFLKRHPDYQLLHEQSTLPSFTSEPARYRDGGYFAVMSRR